MTTSAGDPAALADTSVAVAALLEDHQLHERAGRLLDRYDQVALVGHAWFETFSVLTRLPSPVRLSAVTAARLIGSRFPVQHWLDPAQQRQLADRLVPSGIRGGAVYDALVGWSAVVARQPLLSLDRRARPTYQALGALVVDR